MPADKSKPKKRKDTSVFQRLMETWEGISPEEGDRAAAEADYAQKYWAPVNEARAAAKQPGSGTYRTPIYGYLAKPDDTVISPEEEAQTRAEQRFMQEYGRVPTRDEGARPGAIQEVPLSEDAAFLDLEGTSADVEAETDEAKERRRRDQRRAINKISNKGR